MSTFDMPLQYETYCTQHDTYRILYNIDYYGQLYDISNLFLVVSKKVDVGGGWFGGWL